MLEVNNDIIQELVEFSHGYLDDVKSLISDRLYENPSYASLMAANPNAEDAIIEKTIEMMLFQMTISLGADNDKMVDYIERLSDAGANQYCSDLAKGGLIVKPRPPQTGTNILSNQKNQTS